MVHSFIFLIFYDLYRVCYYSDIHLKKQSVVSSNAR
jgi:hypothetical protein